MMISFDFIPMVRIGGQTTVVTKMPQWFSSDAVFSGSSHSQVLEVLRAGALAGGASLDMYPSRVVSPEGSILRSTSTTYQSKPAKRGLTPLLCVMRPSTSSVRLP